jgi:hypothetical protein
MPFDTETTLLFVLLGIIVLLILWIIRLEVKMKRLLAGKDAKSLEDSFINLRKNTEDLLNFRRESHQYFRNLDERLKRSIQSVETVRFNPFKGTGAGGNQSFSTVFVSENGDGVVISGLHSRDRISVFSKPLKGFSSEFEMSGEEKHVLGEAKNNLSK